METRHWKYRRSLKYRLIDWWWYRLKDLPGNIKFYTKRSIQRAIRGWADSDVWSVDYFLIEILPPMLRRLKTTKQGIPVLMFKDQYEYSDEAFRLAEKKWNKRINRMIRTFELARKIVDYETLTKKEEKEYKIGWACFQKHFFNLWD